MALKQQELKLKLKKIEKLLQALAKEFDNFKKKELAKQKKVNQKKRRRKNF